MKKLLLAAAVVARPGLAGARDDRYLRLLRRSYPLYAAPPGETLYTDFIAGLPSGATGDGSLYPPGYGVQCIGSSCVAAPGLSTSALTSQQFFAVVPGQS